MIYDIYKKKKLENEFLKKKLWNATRPKFLHTFQTLAHLISLNPLHANFFIGKIKMSMNL